MRLSFLFTLLSAAAAITPTSSTTSTADGADGAASAAAVCSDLAHTLPPSAILTPSLSSSNDETAYTTVQTAGFNALNNVLRPACIVQPTTTQHVAAVMRSVFEHGAKYAVRAGGHTGMAGWDGVSSGVLVDLSHMVHFAFDPKAQVVEVGPGLRWEQIYALASAHGVAPLGGRVGHVGTGLLLGGGLSIISPQHGYACDGIVAAQIVLVNGTVRHVDAHTDPDLLRAVKGGGGRVGVVTRYTLRAFPTGHKTDKRWFGGMLLSFDHAGMDEMVRLTEEFTAEPEDDPRATVLANVGFVKRDGTSMWVGTTFLFYRGTQREFERVFYAYLSIKGVVADVKPLSYWDATQVTPLGWKPDQAYKWMGGSLYPSASTYLSLWSNVTSFLHTHERVLDSAFLSLTPVRAHQVEQGYRAGGNALSPPRNGRGYAHWLFSNTLAPGTTAFPEQLERDRLRLIEENPSSKGLPLLLNEVDASQNVFETYGWYEELKRQYESVDPSGFSVAHQQGPMF